MKLIFRLETKTIGHRDPDKLMLSSKKFNLLWNRIKNWDIGKPLDQEDYAVNLKAFKHTTKNRIYSGSTGTDIRTILDTLSPQRKL